MKPSQTFTGFQAKATKSTPIPNPFFSELLPIIDHLGELKVTLYAFWALAKKDGRYRYLSHREMASDRLLLNALRIPAVLPEEALEEALERAVARESLLKVTLAFAQGEEILYFLNTPKGRSAIEAIQAGKWSPSGEPKRPLALEVEVPNLFTLYEQNIGPLTPMIADSLRDAEETYPEDWIKEAIRIAVENNARKWSYISAILEGWRSRGKDAREDRGDTEKARQRYLKGWFDD